MGNTLIKETKIHPMPAKKSKGVSSAHKPEPGVKEAPKTAQTRAHEPGEGIRSMKTSGVFRALNFELYTRPNKPTMIIGVAAILFCAGYITYMNLSIDRNEFYTAEAQDGSLVLRPKKSRWES